MELEEGEGEGVKDFGGRPHQTPPEGFPLTSAAPAAQSIPGGWIQRSGERRGVDGLPDGRVWGSHWCMVAGPM